MVIQKVRRFRLKSDNILHKKKKKNENLTFLNENQQYVYHHEIEEECREFYFCLTVFSRVTSST